LDAVRERAMFEVEEGAGDSRAESAS
jgi:hypothetical protein